MDLGLSDRVYVVAGASRGVGRGVAKALGDAGATVIVTGRSSEAGPHTDQRPETFEDAAREVEAAGGKLDLVLLTHHHFDHAEVAVDLVARMLDDVRGLRSRPAEEESGGWRSRARRLLGG